MADRVQRKELLERAITARLIAATIVDELQECRRIPEETHADAARLRAQRLRGEARLLKAILTPDPPDE